MPEKAGGKSKNTGETPERPGEMPGKAEKIPGESRRNAGKLLGECRGKRRKGPEWFGKTPGDRRDLQEDAGKQRIIPGRTGKYGEKPGNTGEPGETQNNTGEPGETRGNTGEPGETRGNTDEPGETRGNTDEPGETWGNTGEPGETRGNPGKPGETQTNTGKHRELTGGNIMDTATELLSFIARCPSPYHVVRESAARLEAAGFTPLSWGSRWRLAPGGRYYTPVFGSALFAFRVGPRPEQGIRLAAAHTDFPGFRLKPRAGKAQEGYGLVNAEPYGGLILSSWLDRPLSLAGQIALRSDDPFAPELRVVDLARPVLTIPRLAIHLNREVNEKGEKLDRQTDMTPLAALLDEDAGDDYLEALLARALDVAPEDLLAWDLNLYPAEPGCALGFNGELVSSPRLDDLSGVKACLDAILAEGDGDGIRVAALFDHEEVGSRTKQGAASDLLPLLLEAVFRGLGRGAEDQAAAAARGFLLSVDVAHGLHPCHGDKADPTNRPRLGGGVVIKQAASQNYVGDAAARAMVLSLCQQRDIPCQQFANRSSIPGGSTLGSMVSARLAMRGQDVGVPILAMHSARETMAAADQQALEDLVRAFLA